jgi:two-component system chemotaxis response regulator CheB
MIGVASMTEGYTLDRPSALTCPECGGAVSRQESGTLPQYRCHIGHVFTAETMLAAQFDELEKTLASAFTSLKERAELCRQMAEGLPDGRGRDTLEVASKQATERALVLKQLLESEWVQLQR